MDTGTTCDMAEDGAAGGSTVDAGTSTRRRGGLSRRAIAALVVAGGLGAACAGAVMGGALDRTGISPAAVRPFDVSGAGSHSSGDASAFTTAAGKSFGPGLAGGRREAGSIGASGATGTPAVQGSAARPPATSRTAGTSGATSSPSASSAAAPEAAGSQDAPSSQPAGADASPVPVVTEPDGVTLPTLSSAISELGSVLGAVLPTPSPGTTSSGGEPAGTPGSSGAGTPGSLLGGL